MNSLNDYFGKNPEQDKQDIKKKQELQKNEEINKLLENIKSEQCLWDMQAWKKYKDKQEVREWIRNSCHPNNCGHVEYCIEKLLGMKVPEEVIIDAVMGNPYKQFSKRITPCFINPDLCPRYRKYGNYSDCNCSECCDSKG